MLNYKHLHYFQQVAEAGGISRASERLHVSPQTISTQISELEDRLGVELFVKNGRSLELTETGRLTLQYARDIFTTGAELEAVLGQVSETSLTRDMAIELERSGLIEYVKTEGGEFFAVGGFRVWRAVKGGE